MSSPIKRALLSVSDKTQLVELAKTLQEHHIEIVSTGGSAELLKKAGVSVTFVSDYTGFPELMEGRLKTLHPKIHGGILAREEDVTILENYHIHPIDFVIVNLYPFQKTIANPACTLAEAIEQIDIGGPAMIRAAAKNYHRVTVVVDPSDYKSLINELDTHQGQTTLSTRQKLAQKAFTHTATYDTAIAHYLSQSEEEFSLQLPSGHVRKEVLRYGENPHQRAAVYAEMISKPGQLAHYHQLQGKPLSYNNLLDADAAWATVNAFSEIACVIVKHANPCGVAISHEQADAYQKALETDPQSAFGGILAFNRPLTVETAQALLTSKQFVEVLVAPEADEVALTLLANQKNWRILICGTPQLPMQKTLQGRSISGGLLLQELDSLSLDDSLLSYVTHHKPSEEDMRDLRFAWTVAKYVKSNAIVYAKNGQTLGIGAGQMSRVDSTTLAALKAEKAGLSLQGAVMASDAFFPFPDSIEAAAQVGIRAIIQPGGSVKDASVIEAADAANITMVLTHIRHFRH